MTTFFREDEIEEFKQGFHLHARQSKRDNDRVTALKSVDELKAAMMSLGMSPTLHELRQYIKDNSGKIIFAEFLEVMNKAKNTEQIPEDILEGFRAQDRKKTGKLPAKDVWYMLHQFDGMTTSEIERLFRDARVNLHGDLDYANFVKIICSSPINANHYQTNEHYQLQNGEPKPDYY